uniref:Retrotransposon protein, putative, Ty3-gypsy subclass n=1 Tax=Oryza sativa subsp. japonica TaxID=39947 RepID=Q10LX9_ORYSJ|nr:retrotransposon protein, putative, Ty3-gypsy subclass [Oryza sativa Japonica Group]
MARRRERRAPGRRGRRGELTSDQNGGGRSTDGDGVEEEAASTFGLTTATMLRRSSATAKGRTRTATRRRPRWRPPRATATTGATAEHGWSGGDNGGARLHGARALSATRGEGEGGDG